MNFGTIIIKPDFFEDIKYLYYFNKLLEKNSCIIKDCFIIKNYIDINNTYRKLELKKRYRKKQDFEKNYSRSIIAYNSYKLLKSNNVGLLLKIIQNKKTNKKEFHNTLYSIKNKLREFIETSRGYVYLYINNKNNDSRLISAKQEEFDSLKKEYGKDIKLAFINGIHLEDFALFKKNYCYKTYKKIGLINKYNCINPNDISILFNRFNNEIDLHIHSSFSDGKYNLEDIVTKSKNLNIKYASITDHDTIANVNLPDNFIKGVEFNAIANNKKYHILCYGMDTNNKSFKRLLEIQKQNRIRQLNNRIKQLKQFYNVTFSKVDIDNLIKNNHFSREYLADMLIQYNYSSSKKDALKDYINNLNHGRYLIDIKILRKFLHKANGHVVLPHPLGNYKHRTQIDDLEESNKSLLKLVDGIECFYSSYNNEEIRQLFKIAKKYNLIPTCGSDFHGTRADEQIGKISSNTLSFDNICNYLIAKQQIANTLFRRKL